MRTEVQKKELDSGVVIIIDLFDGDVLAGHRVLDVTESFTKNNVDDAIASMTAEYESRDKNKEMEEKQKKAQLSAIADSVLAEFSVTKESQSLKEQLNQP